MHASINLTPLHNNEQLFRRSVILYCLIITALIERSIVSSLVHPSIRHPIHQFIPPSFHPLIHPSLPPFLALSFRLSLIPSVRPSFHPSLPSSIYPSKDKFLPRIVRYCSSDRIQILWSSVHIRMQFRIALLD